MPECPMCHHFFETPTLICKRCGHEWIQRTLNLPKLCPKCKSPYWNKERRKANKSQERTNSYENN